MVKSPIIEDYILKNQLEKIPEAIAASNGYYNMQTMNQALERMVAAGLITADQALKSSTSYNDLKLRLDGFVREQGYELAGAFETQSSLSYSAATTSTPPADDEDNS